MIKKNRFKLKKCILVTLVFCLVIFSLYINEIVTYSMSSTDFATIEFEDIGTIENTSKVLQKQTIGNYVFSCTLPGEYYIDIKAPKAPDTQSVAGIGGAGAGINGKIKLEVEDKLYIVCTKGENGTDFGSGSSAGMVAVYLNSVSEENLICIAGGGGGGRLGGPYNYYALEQVSPWPNYKVDWVPHSGYLPPVNGGEGGRYLAEMESGVLKWFDSQNSQYIDEPSSLIQGDMKGKSNSDLQSYVTVPTGKHFKKIYSGNGGDGYFGGGLMQGGASYINKDILVDGYNLTNQNFTTNPIINLSMKQEKQLSNYSEILELIKKYSGAGIPTITVQQDCDFVILLPQFEGQIDGDITSQIGDDTITISNKNKNDMVVEVSGNISKTGYSLLKFDDIDLLFNVLEGPDSSNVKVILN